MNINALPLRKKINGILFRKDAFGAYVPEFREDLPTKLKIRVPDDCLLLLSDIRREIQELFVVITLDGVNQAIKKRVVTRGLVNLCHIHPRETFACAVEDRAVSIIVAHNHPSGSLDPSTEDLITTRRLAEAGRLLGIPLIDHLIVGEGGFLSLKERFPDIFNQGVR